MNTCSAQEVSTGLNWGCHSLITAPQTAANKGSFPSWDMEAELGADVLQGHLLLLRLPLL